MAGTRSAGRRGEATRAAAAGLMLALGLSSSLGLSACSAPRPQPAPSGLSEPLPAPLRTPATAAPVPAAPEPEPQGEPLPASVTGPLPDAQEVPGKAPETGPPAEPELQAGAPVNGAAAPAAAGPQSEPTAPASIPGGLPSTQSSALRTVTAYYVLLDDGGANGVRFGCNDSLVGVARISLASEDALPAAMGDLLEPAPSPAPGGPEPREPLPDVEAPDEALSNVYNALSGSRLDFLSGSFDGTTVTVYLAGQLSPGGACDLPRVEAQLTQTAVAAVGAIRAEIYVNGQPLADALRLN
jgi:hypothetical protein